jgi:VWFA-related protein
MMKAMRRSIAAACLAGGLAWSWPVAAALAQQSPVFRSGVDLVTVDATVVDGTGQPVEGLGPDDFRLEVDGEPRRIISVQFVSRAASSADLSPHIVTNERADAGRLVLVGVDQANIRRLEGRAALRAAGRFLDTLSSFDRVAVTSIGEAGPIEFTTDHAGARRRVERLVGEADWVPFRTTFNVGLAEALSIADGGRARLDQAVRRECGAPLASFNSPERAAENEGMREPCPIQLEQEARSVAQQVRTQGSLTLNGLTSLITRLESIDGPKTLVLLSEGLIAEPPLVDLTVFGAAALAARVTVYVLQLETPLVDVADERVSPTMLEDVQLRADGLARLAGAARGALFRLVGGDPEPFRRITRELSGYYLLAFEPGEADRDGRTHRISVRLEGRRATLRARQAFRLDPAGVALGRTEQRLLDLLRSNGAATELPLRVATYFYTEPDGSTMRLVVGAEAGEDGDTGADVLFGYVLLDAKQVIAASQVLETYARRFTSAAALAPGEYTLKVAAIDRLGRAGSVMRAFHAEAVAGGRVRASDLLVARVGDRADAPIDAIVGGTAERRVLAYLELYADEGPALREVDVMVHVVQPDTGAPLVRAPAMLASAEPGRAVARAVLQLQDLPDGDYLVRAQIEDASGVIGRAERPLTVRRASGR